MNLSGQLTALTERAHERLLEVLGALNKVSLTHSQASRQLLAGMAAQALGVDSGRYAYGLPCGGGKTQGVIALIAASHELGLDLTFAVATSQIESLCCVKRDLIRAGIPEQYIGLMHSYQWRQGAGFVGPGTDYASEPATPVDQEYSILLLSHSKIQHGHTATYQGRPRSLLIWDESLLSTTARTLAVHEMQGALGECKRRTPRLVPLIQKVLTPVEDELARLVSDERQTPRILSNLLDLGEMDEARQLVRTIDKRGGFGAAAHGAVTSMLRLIEQPVSVATTGGGGSGDGVLRYEVKVDDRLKNIAILDASHVLRELTQADPSIEDRSTPDMLNYKSYSAVTVRQMRMPTGKSTLITNLEASLDAAREVQRILDLVSADECVLIFTFKDAVRRLELNLDKLGVDRAKQLTVDGESRKRIEILTWGQETSRNDLLHCRHVVMVGVLRRNPLDLSASLTGQQRSGNLPQRHSSETLRRLNLSEMAHCVLQGMNRGSCRVMEEDGKAQSMTVAILVSGADGLEEILRTALPGVQWEHVQPSGRVLSRTRRAALDIVTYLSNLPGATTRVSVSKLKTETGITLGREAMQEAVNTALVMLFTTGQQWRRDARSLVQC